MQCPSCEFHNMPGSAGCLRCGSPLDLSAVCIDPPRASKHGMVRAGNKFRHAIHSRYHPLRLLPTDSPTLRMLAPMDQLGFDALIPGLPQYCRGHKGQGKLLFALWTTTLLTTCIMLGNWWSWFLAYILINIHTFSLTLVIFKNVIRTAFLQRVVLSLVTYLGLFTCIYLPVVWFASGFVQVRMVERMAGSDTLRQGDSVLMLGRWLAPQSYNRGDIVYYTYLRPGYAPYQPNAYTPGLDRITGLPGDTVRINDGRVTIQTSTGAILPFRTLVPVNSRANAEMLVEPGTFSIVPTTVVIASLDSRWVSLTIDSMSRINQTRIEGKVFWRIRPLHRMGPIN